MRRFRTTRRGSLAVVLAATLVLGAVGVGPSWAHTVTNPPPSGPENTFVTQNGGYGLLCGVKYNQITDVVGGWEAGAITNAKYSPGGICNGDLDLDANLIKVQARVQRSDATYCAGYSTAYNPWGAAYNLALVVTTQCGTATGQRRTVSVHRITLYSDSGNNGWQTPYH
jgi:hypothetical protein